MAGHPTRSFSLRGLLLPLLVASASSAATTLVDSSGALTKALLPAPTGDGGIVALLSSPGTPGPFSSSSATVSVDGDVISAPGASLEESSGPLARGTGSAAAASVAGAVVLTGVTLADVELGLDGTRHGRTLAEMFASALRTEKKEGVTTLIVAVQSDGAEGGSLDAEEIEEVVEEIFDGVAAAVGADDELGDRFSVRSMLVSTPEDVAKVMSEAKSAAKGSPPPKSLPTAFSDAYKRIASATDDADPTPVAEALLACNDAYSRASRLSRAKIASMKHRISRNLLVPKYGYRADALLKRTLDLFDRDTMAAAGLPRAGEQRLIIRKKLQDRTEGILKRLFDDQMALLEKNTLKRFQASLLRRMAKDADPAQFYESNAEALRMATFAFGSAASSLEVPSMSLTKTKAVKEMEGKLNNALVTFPDSPAAKIKSLQKVKQTVSKKKEPTEGSISVALDLVAMIRPDGFGNLQGFAGYQLGPHSITVGVHNDADDPGVISQFGGVRPAFLRVQPKLKLDVEL
eukprot:CAMPEP_0172528690 /NCGR_PEP_ID=MMETSP1067-20121228/2999_1 /TAXON_ID=265564 ORGANISM="Thalassiosira punctigera, Strain Tpunct2005C2" /NCGR_SAMPLE_ID=MMETSP1067 /ASSEMBLY_ACC=CAM_ASM_000444 /LENGTH=517 /DNA_ID=CAMNT_0013312647 /DNA_START=14 /DNA_END=1567 /DNA_ORIENTATION=-